MGTQQVNVPDIGGAEGVEVIEILVNPGDRIEKEQSLIVVESDKASMEIPAEAGGVVQALKVSLGDKVSEGDPILVLEIAGDAAPAPAATESTPEQPAAPEPAASPDPAPEAAASGGTRIDSINVPDIGGAEGVTVIEVCVAEGDEIAKDEALVVLESDKASMEVPSPASGIIRAVKVAVDDTVSEGSPLVDLEVRESAAPAPSTAEPAAKPEPAKPAPAAAAPASKPAAPAAKQATDAPGSAVHAGPAVRRLAREFGVRLQEVTGSGRKGRILKEDVQQYVRDRLSRGGGTGGEGAGLPPMPEVDFSRFGETEIVDLSKINRLSAANLHRSWLHVPHVTQFDEADITELEKFRKAHNANLGADGTKLTMLPFIVKACAVALRRYPRFNASLHPSGEQLIVKKYCHIGVAVDTPNGLVVPVIRDADTKGIEALATECGELAAKARNKKLRPDDMQGGCFSISSLGGIGGTSFTPIVNAPEVAILGLSRSSLKPVHADGAFVPRLMLPLCLSYDHRVIDGALAARFTTTLSELLSDIRRLLL